MKKIISIIRIWLPLFFAAAACTTVQAQSVDKCNMLGNQCEVDLISTSGSALTDIKTGLDFNVSLTLPGQLNCNGQYNVSITTSTNIIQGTTASTYPYQFISASANQYINGTVLPSTGAGLGINIPFKFVPGTTCNGETGKFTITIGLTCADGSKHECVLHLSIKAIAQNYWVVEKNHVFGDLSGGAIYWDVIIRNTNPNPGIGDLNIYSGTIKDVVTSDAVVAVTGNVIGLTGLNTATAQWSTGTIPSTVYNVVYHVTTYSCKPPGTVVENCVDYNFCLGKKNVINPHLSAGEGAKAVSNDAKALPATGAATLPSICCSGATGHVCAHVTLTGTPVVSSNFGKSLTYGNNLNYSPGCEGEYQITVANNGNVPLNNLVVTDNFPSTQIDVTQITVTASGTNMNYDVAYGTPTTPYNTSGSPYPNYSQTWPSGYPTQFKLTTTSGTLLGGTITIKVRFRIKANISPGTVVNNCASLSYSGTYDGWSNWCGIMLPPAGQGTTAQSCIPFTVQQPKAIPGIVKCIPSGQQTYSVGDIIHFRVVVSNHGAANFSGNLSDLLGTPQNLQYMPGSITYAHGVGDFNPYSTNPSCISPASLSNPSSWSPPVLTTTSQNISGAITNMPGDCELDKAYYLIIEFDAKILPQSFGNYINTAKLTTPTGTLTSDAYYTVMRVAKIITGKKASTGYAEAGQPFSYIVDVINAGSVGLGTLKVEDILPGCVTASGGATAIKITAAGIITSVPVSGSAPNFSFGAATIQPGDTIRLSIPVTRGSSDMDKPCCNPKAKATGTTTDANAQTISDENGPACVVSSLCCNITDANVSFSVGNVNGVITPVFLITTGSPLPIQEIEISLIDYHAEYNNAACKPLNMGDLFGHIQPFAGYNSGVYSNFNTVPPSGTPSLQLQTVINPPNNSLTWSGTTPINLNASSSWNFNGLIALSFVAPNIINLDCCSGKVFFCFKVRIMDVNCNVCEKIVCGSAEIPKAGAGNGNHFTSEKARNQVILQSLDNGPSQDRSNTPAFKELFKRK